MNITEEEALRLFRIVHGPGDGGDPRQFNMMSESSQRGWRRLAHHVLTREYRAVFPTPDADGLFPAILYFPTAQDASDFLEMVKKAKPNLTERKL